jgi:hypothetical protein
MNWPWKKKRKPVEFIIEHYPVSGVWVARHKDRYICMGYPSKVPELCSYSFHAEQCKSEEEARKLIEMYKEYRGGGGIKYIAVQ